jgi:hypothetical protein
MIYVPRREVVNRTSTVVNTGTTRHGCRTAGPGQVTSRRSKQASEATGGRSGAYVYSSMPPARTCCRSTYVYMPPARLLRAWRRSNRPVGGDGRVRAARASRSRTTAACRGVTDVSVRDCWGWKRPAGNKAFWRRRRSMENSPPGRRPHARVTYRMPRARLGVFGKHGNKLKSLVLAF